ncbi:glutamate synthase-related protein [Streptomyces novaecaesareae]|uniref:glutamate synthase-related protein n=1 Tax=Streptomyces novaecaesareae TaxID=68244 RepID=UPI000691FDB8|nr:glutamate synthase-related protein [Streptomyces novaecaesareae]
MSALHAVGLPEAEIRTRARTGTAAAFPAADDYGHTLYGDEGRPAADPLDRARLVPPVFVPQRLEKLIDLGREPLFSDVELATTVGGFASALPLYVSAFGSTQVASRDLGVAAARQAGRLGLPMVIGENIVPVQGYGRAETDEQRALLRRIEAYAGELPDGLGGLVVQQSTEDADAEVWNLVYSDPGTRGLLESGRLGFELKVGQGAKPGLGGMTVLPRAEAARLADRFQLQEVFGPDDPRVLRSGSPGTFTDEILRQQIRLMRNNFPHARVWVKLPPARDVAAAAAVAWAAGADAVTVDGAEGGSGWAPSAFPAQVGLPLHECLRRVSPTGCLLAAGRIWEGARAAKALALGATAVGLGRAALLAVDEDPQDGLARLVECLALELRLITSALGVYSTGALTPEDVWFGAGPETAGAAYRQMEGHLRG